MNQFHDQYGLPTPAPPKRPILPPFTYGAIRSTTLIPVSKICVSGERSSNLGAGRWIGHFHQPPQVLDHGLQFPKYVKDTTQYTFPTGTKLEVEHQYLPLPYYRAMSSVQNSWQRNELYRRLSVAQPLLRFLSIVCLCGHGRCGWRCRWLVNDSIKRTSTTGPMTCTTTNITHRQMSPYLLQGISATNDFRNFVCNARLTQLVVFKA